jgi:hypothetical protein
MKLLSAGTYGCAGYLSECSRPDFLRSFTPEFTARRLAVCEVQNGQAFKVNASKETAGTPWL